MTGVAGFIGSHVADGLLRYCSVVGVDCFTDFYPREVKESNLADLMANDRFRFMEADLLEVNLEELDVDYIFHQAAQPGVRASWGKNFQVYVRDNILVTQRLLEGCLNSGVKKFVFASSSSVYGDATELPIREDALPKPVSPYGATKLAAENMCYLYWKNYGLPAVSLRYFSVYGPRQRPDMAINKFVKAMLKDEAVVIYGDGGQTRDFTYISDVVNANILAAESHLDGEVFNIGSGVGISVNALIDLLEGILGKSAERSYVEKRKGDVRHTIASIEKAQRLLGYRPSTSIEEGLKSYVRWASGFML